MARIIFGSYMVRYPLGGVQSWILQYMIGLKDLGHDVFFFEKYGYENSCYDPVKAVMSNDCSYGLEATSRFLATYGFGDRWCYVGFDNTYYGMPETAVKEIFRTADIYIDMGAHGSWNEEAGNVPLKIRIEGEPGFTQIKMANKIKEGEKPDTYDMYFTNGFNVGAEGNEVPTCGIHWNHLFHPVKTSLFTVKPVRKQASFTSIMNWSSHHSVEYNGKTYGQKDMEFLHFLELPKKSNATMELALSSGGGGKEVPYELIQANGWKMINSQEVTKTFDSFQEYISGSRGEFRVCKNVFVALRTGWFSDVSACYLASGRPVVAQDTCFSRHLPVGLGLFAVNDTDSAAYAIEQIEKDYEKHSKAAREIAKEYLEAEKVMKKFMDSLP